METVVEKKRGISGNTLKIIAIVTMLIDHVGAGIGIRLLYQTGYMDLAMAGDVNGVLQWQTEHGMLLTVYSIMRMIGRVAFPIFCFLLVEGFTHTKDVKKYALRLGAFALISEIPFDLAFNNKVLEFGYQNVFFTLFFGLLAMVGLSKVEERFENGKVNKGVKFLASVGVIAVCSVIAELLNTDYGAIGVLCIVVLYLFCKRKVAQIVAGCVSFAWEITAPLAFIPIGFYNGERGMKLKYFFYAFYPVHLLLIYLVAVLMGLGQYAAM